MTVMAQPTQDTDISSSFTPINLLQNNDSSRNLYSKNIMDEESKMNFMQTYKTSADISENFECQEFQHVESGSAKLSEETFPWLNKFNKVMCSSVGSRSYQLLHRLLSVYTQNISTSMNTCCIKMSQMMKLKNHLNSTLIFFHLYRHDIKEHVSDNDSYLNAMSVLLGLYIDMELKSFKHGKDSTKIAAKLFTMLWVYLSNSDKHIFRVLLRLKFITKKYTKICDPIFMKSFTSLRRKKESISDVDYIRYLLVFKFWKRIKENSDEKKKVNKFALVVLGPRMPKMRDELLKIIPRPPTGQENDTIWLLQPNVFDLQKTRDHFLALEESMSTSIQFRDSHLKMPELNNHEKSLLPSVYSTSCFQEHSTNNEASKSQMIILANNNLFENAAISNKSSMQHCKPITQRKPKKYKTMTKLKPGEVILIDLTKEDESMRIRGSKQRKTKNKRKLEWLKIMRQRYKVHKEINGLHHKNQVEIADAHSTESSENTADKVLLKYLPISDNKVSESTESCALHEREPLQNNSHYINSKNVQSGNKRSKELKCTLQNKHCDICTLSLKQSELKHNRVLCLLKLLNTVSQNVKDPKAILNLIKESKEQDSVSTHHTFLDRNPANMSNEVNVQNKGEGYPQQKSSIETILLSKECQNSIANIQSIKQELPTSTDYNITTEANNYNENESGMNYVQNSDCHLNNSRSVSHHSSQTIEATKQKMSCDVNEFPSCCKKIDTNSITYHNSNVFSTVKSEDAMQNMDDDTPEKKPMCDKNIMCMLSDLDKCVDVLNRIGEHIMSVHAEKQRVENAEKSDVCRVSTTVFADQLGQSSLGCWAQNINSLSNSEKLNSILELYGKKEFLSACDSKDFHRSSAREPNTVLNQLEHDLKHCKQAMVSTSESDKLYLYDNDVNHTTLSPFKLPENCICNHIKSELEEPSNEETSSKNYEIMIEQKRNEFRSNIAGNTDTYSSKSPEFDKTATDLSNQDVRESSLQTFSQNTEIMNTNSMDEFENIDILDSILNGDMIMENEPQILEDSQSSMMSPISYDNSTNVLNCITEFFTQSEHSYSNKIEEESYITSDIETFPKSLPEGSLGTTGILNSLLDYDLTNMDSPPSDFMYSNVQTVNPRLIKKNLEQEIFTPTCHGISTLSSQGQEFLSKKKNIEDALSQKEDESINNGNNSLDSSVDVVGFGLNTRHQRTVQFPSLIRNADSLSDQPSISINSDVLTSGLRESSLKHNLSSPSDRCGTDAIVNRFHTFHKEDAVKKIQSPNGKASASSAEHCSLKNISSNILTNLVPNQSNNTTTMHKHMAVNSLELEQNPTMKQPLDSCNSLSSTNLISCSTTTILQRERAECESLQKQFTSQSTFHENLQEEYKEKQTSITKRRSNAQPRSAKKKLRNDRKNKEQDEEDEPFIVIEENAKELNFRYPQLTFDPLKYRNTQIISELPSSSLHKSLHQKSPHTVYTSQNMYQQLKCVDFQQLNNVSECKQLNINGKQMAGIILKEDPKTDNIQVIEDPTVSYKSTRKPSMSRHRTCFKFSKKNTTVGTDDTEMNLPKNKPAVDISKNILIKSSNTWSIQNINTEASKFIKKQVDETNLASNNEETSLKRRKVTSKFIPVVETDDVVCSINQQGTRGKRIVSMKSDFSYTGGRRKSAIVR